MRSSRYEGRVWMFGSDVSTDLILPGRLMALHPVLQHSPSRELAQRYCMDAIRPGWAALVRDGDIIVGGKNFGCGSDRPAAKILKALGIQVVIAESMARLFFRNAINSGVVALEAPGIMKACREGDIVGIDLEEAVVTNVTTGVAIPCTPLKRGTPPRDIVDAGGIRGFWRTLSKGARGGQ